MIDGYTIRLTSLAWFATQIVGLLSTFHALRRVRTSQATIAWCVGMLTLPVLVVPLYWVFGRSRFFGYLELLRQAMDEQRVPAQQYDQYLTDSRSPQPPDDSPLHRLAQGVRRPVTVGNRLQLLIDGDQTFAAILEAIRGAQHYVLVQFFIIRNDVIGRQFAAALMERAREGVEVRLLYDDIGCQWLPRSYLRELEKAGVIVSSFNMREGFRHRLQINFRNHRKIVVIDGQVAFTGGLNIGDEYRGLGPFEHWRDTHLRVEGPAVQAIQVSFALDWYWARHEPLSHLIWKSRRTLAAGGQEEELGEAVVIPTGPADERQYCTMMFCEMATQAKQRLWIATPYFVPNESVATALEAAAARGVDVRVLLPRRADHALSYFAGMYYEDELSNVGVKVFRYEKGFMHHKVVLVDNSIAAVGSTNLDNRSLHLNFEMMVAANAADFCRDVEQMLLRDFSQSRQTEMGTLDGRPYLFQILVGAARLFSPVL